MVYWKKPCELLIAGHKHARSHADGVDLAVSVSEYRYLHFHRLQEHQFITLPNETHSFDMHANDDAGQV